MELELREAHGEGNEEKEVSPGKKRNHETKISMTF